MEMLEDFGHKLPVDWCLQYDLCKNFLPVDPCPASCRNAQAVESVPWPSEELGSQEVW